MTPRVSIPTTQTLEDPNLINSIYYELKEASAEASLLNGEETLRISEVGGAEVGSRLTFVSWTKHNTPYFCTNLGCLHLMPLKTKRSEWLLLPLGTNLRSK